MKKSFFKGKRLVLSRLQVEEMKKEKFDNQELIVQIIDANTLEVIGQSVVKKCDTFYTNARSSTCSQVETKKYDRFN